MTQKEYEQSSSLKKRLIKLVHSKDILPLIEEITQHANHNFDVLLDTLRTQRILTASRKLDRIEEIHALLSVAIPKLSLNGKKKSQLKKHLIISLEFQRIMTMLAEKSKRLELWRYSFESILVSVVQHTDRISLRVNHDKALETVLKAESFDGGLSESISRHHYVRETSDAANIIANEARRLKSRNKLGAISGPISLAHLIAAFAVAEDTDRANQLWDFCSYTNAHVDVSDAEISIRTQRTGAQNAADIFRKRQASADSVNIMHQRKAYFDAAQKHLKIIKALTMSSLEDFLDSEEGKALQRDLADIHPIVTKLILNSVADEIDLDRTFTFDSGDLSARQMADLWGSLSMMVAAGKLWQTAIYERKNVVLPLAFRATWLASKLATVLNVTHVQMNQLIEQFQCAPLRGERIDLFYRPIIKHDDVLVVAATFVESSRFDRNLLTIIVDEARGDISEKGLLRIDKLIAVFERAGFAALKEKKVFDEHGKLITDIDLSISKDEETILFQSKVIIQSDSSYEEWKARGTLEHAADQMDAARPHLRRYLRRHRKKLGLSEGNRITLAILCNVWNYTGSRVRHYPVVDFSYVKFLLSGATINLIRADTQSVVSQQKLFPGRYPSGKQFVELILNPVHGETFKPQEPVWVSMKICERVFCFLALGVYDLTT